MGWLIVSCPQLAGVHDPFDNPNLQKVTSMIAVWLNSNLKVLGTVSS